MKTKIFLIFLLVMGVSSIINAQSEDTVINKQVYAVQKSLNTIGTELAYVSGAIDAYAEIYGTSNKAIVHNVPFENLTTNKLSYFSAEKKFYSDYRDRIYEFSFDKETLDYFSKWTEQDKQIAALLVEHKLWRPGLLPDNRDFIRRIYKKNPDLETKSQITYEDIELTTKALLEKDKKNEKLVTLEECIERADYGMGEDFYKRHAIYQTFKAKYNAFMLNPKSIQIFAGDTVWEKIFIGNCAILYSFIDTVENVSVATGREWYLFTKRFPHIIDMLNDYFDHKFHTDDKSLVWNKVVTNDNFHELDYILSFIDNIKKETSETKKESIKYKTDGNAGNHQVRKSLFSKKRYR